MKFIDIWKKYLRQDQRKLETIRRNIRKLQHEEKRKLNGISHWVKTIEKEQEYEKENF